MFRDFSHRTLFEQTEAVANLYDNTNVMMWKLGPKEKKMGSYIVTTDFPFVHEVDPDSLAVKRKLSLDPMRDGMSMGTCAHFRREVGKNSSLNFHMMYNPLSLHPDFVLYRFHNSWEVKSRYKD